MGGYGAPQPRQTRWRAAEVGCAGASRVDVMAAFLSSSQAGAPVWTELAPATCGHAVESTRYRVERGGCRGVFGPFPSAPLDEVFSCPPRVSDRRRSRSARSHLVSQLTTSFFRQRYQARPRNRLAYTTAEMTPLPISSVWTGLDSRPNQAFSEWVGRTRRRLASAVIWSRMLDRI